LNILIKNLFLNIFQTIFQESTEDEIVNRILEINPKFRRIETTVLSPCLTPNNGTHDHHDKLRSEQQEEISKRAAEIKTNVSKTSASSYQHNEFIKAIIEQQKLELEHQQKLQQEQQVDFIF